MIRGAVFDMDGTLLDSMGFWLEVGERYLRSRGREPEPHLGEKLFEMTMEEGAVYLAGAYGLPEGPEEVAAGIDRIIQAFYAREVRPKAHVTELLEALRGAGVPMAVATNTRRGPAEGALGRLGLLPYFEALFTCSEVGLSKNEPEIYHLAAARLGSPPGETWIFEDALFAARTAWRAGFRVAAVYDPVSERDQEALRQVCHLYLPDFSGAVERLRGELPTP